MIIGASAAVGAMGLAMIPSPLAKLIPGTQPKKAMAANQNIADGIYAIRYAADSGYSLDLPYGNPSPTAIELYKSSDSPVQIWVIVYDSDADGYRIAPLCGFESEMVLTATASVSENARTAKDEGLATQRWAFKQNTNGAYSICSKADESLCVNVWTGVLQNNQAIKLWNKTTDAASQWILDLYAPSVKTNLHYLDDVEQVYDSNFMISNVRENHPEIISMPSGWTVTDDEDGYPDVITYNNGAITSPQAFKIMYRNVGDMGEVAIDILLDLTLMASGQSGYTTSIDLSWTKNDSQGSGSTKGFFAGVCPFGAHSFKLQYTVYNHATGEQISLKGAWLTAGNLNGADCHPSKTYECFQNGTYLYGGGEGVAYIQQEGTVEAYIAKDSELGLFCEGTYFGTNSDKTLDAIGAKGSEKIGVTFKCQDDSPVFWFSTLNYNSKPGLWSYPLLMPMGVLDPGDPSKTASIQG